MMTVRTMKYTINGLMIRHKEVLEIPVIWNIYYNNTIACHKVRLKYVYIQRMRLNANNIHLWVVIGYIFALKLTWSRQINKYSLKKIIFDYLEFLSRIIKYSIYSPSFSKKYCFSNYPAKIQENIGHLNKEKFSPWLK